MSAIAARKAAQRQTQTVVQRDEPVQPIPRTKTHAKKEKRRPSTRTPRRVEVVDSEPEDRVVVEIDVIDIRSDGSEGEEIEQDVAEDEIPTVGETPFDSASELDFQESGLETNARPRKKRRVDALGEAVSSFTPVQGVNIFRLSAEDVGRAFPTLARRKAVLLLLKPDENIVLSGAASITPIQNPIRVFSSTLEPTETITSHAIYAPLTHPLPTIAPSTPTKQTHLPALLPLLPESIAVQPETTIFLLQELPTGLSDIPGPAVGIHKVFPDALRSAFGIPGCHPVLRQASTPVYRYVSPGSWEDALRRVGPSQVGEETPETGEGEEADRMGEFVALVKGAKRSGKSTFARELVNRLLESYGRVAYLDTDLGQSEFGVGGSVGLYILDRPLFGPAFTHPQTPLRSHFIGSLNPRLASTHYLAAIAQLVEQYRYEVQYPLDHEPSAGKITEVVPLVINTQGWVKGLGGDLLLEIERMAEPGWTYTFADASGEGEAGEEAEVQLVGGFGRVTTLEGIPGSALHSRFTAADMRTLAMVGSLHAHFGADGQVGWDFSTPLGGVKPWAVNVEKVVKEVYITGEGADGVVEEDLTLALNGRVIALVERLEGDANGFYKPGRALPLPTETHCLGMGLIRSISPDGKTIHLVTPLLPAALGRASIFICGELELPVCGMLDWRVPNPTVPSASLFGVPWDEVPFLTDGKEQGVGMARRKWRRNIMRRGQA